jgi:hypothetical protein
MFRFCLTVFCDFKLSVGGGEHPSRWDPFYTTFSCRTTPQWFSNTFRHTKNHKFSSDSKQAELTRSCDCWPKVDTTNDNWPELLLCGSVNCLLVECLFMHCHSSNDNQMKVKMTNDKWPKMFRHLGHIMHL